MKNKCILIAIITGLLLTMATMGQEIPPEPSPTPDPVPTPEITSGIQMEPKKEGTVRIGIATVKTKLGPDTSQPEVAESIRQQWMTLLTGPTVESVSIDARLPSQINVEAGQKGCDFVLYSSVSKKAKSSFFGNLINVVVPVLTSQMPTGTSSDPNSTTPQTMAQNGSDIAGNVIGSKTAAKDVITLDLNLLSVNGPTPALKQAFSAKAKTDGEDVLSSLIEQAAEKVLQAAAKKP